MFNLDLIVLFFSFCNIIMGCNSTDYLDTITTACIMGFSYSDSNTNSQGAALFDVLELAHLLDAYQMFLQMAIEAEVLFVSGDTRGAANILHKIWMSPTIVPALLLYECFYARQLILPAWRAPWGMYYTTLDKISGGSRPIVIPSKQTRLSMGVINTLLQTSCKSWSNRTTGFRPNYGTVDAMSLLQVQVIETLNKHKQVHILSFDIKAAFNSVCIQQLFQTLNLSNLPQKIKYLIWQWHHSPIHNWSTNQVVTVNGLPQGFSYSPTLFAWYLDKILISDSNWITYADNIGGVFKSHTEALLALRKVESTLSNFGFKINRDTIFAVTMSNTGFGKLFSTGTSSQAAAWSDSHRFVWLGHGLSLPNCNLHLHQHEQKAPITVPVVITIDQWANMLHKSLWVEQVLLSGWRD